MADTEYNFCAVLSTCSGTGQTPFGAASRLAAIMGSQPVFNNGLVILELTPQTSDTCNFNHVQAMMSFHSIPLPSHNGKT